MKVNIPNINTLLREAGETLELRRVKPASDWEGVWKITQNCWEKSRGMGLDAVKCLSSIECVCVCWTCVDLQHIPPSFSTGTTAGQTRDGNISSRMSSWLRSVCVCVCFSSGYRWVSANTHTHTHLLHLYIQHVWWSYRSSVFSGGWERSL